MAWRFSTNVIENAKLKSVVEVVLPFLRFVLSNTAGLPRGFFPIQVR